MLNTAGGLIRSGIVIEGDSEPSVAKGRTKIHELLVGQSRHEL